MAPPAGRGSAGGAIGWPDAADGTCIITHPQSGQCPNRDFSTSSNPNDKRQFGFEQRIANGMAGSVQMTPLRWGTGPTRHVTLRGTWVAYKAASADAIGPVGCSLRLRRQLDEASRPWRRPGRALRHALLLGTIRGGAISEEAGRSIERAPMVGRWLKQGPTHPSAPIAPYSRTPVKAESNPHRWGFASAARSIRPHSCRRPQLHLRTGASSARRSAP